MTGRRLLPTMLILAMAILLAGCQDALASGIGDPPEYNGPPTPAGIGNGTTYYLSTDGNNDADGLTAGTAWQSVDRLSDAGLGPGDSVLFRRGDIFRLPEDSPAGLVPASGSSAAWILYGAYGSGDLPVLAGSVDLSDESDWTDIGSGLWQTSRVLAADVGQIYLNGVPDAAAKKWLPGDLVVEGDFLSEDSGSLVMRSSGNPASEWSSIEAALTRHIIDQDGLSYAVFEDLHLSMGGAHGFGGANTHHMVIRNCEFSLIGGGVLTGYTEENGDPVRYGNGVEFWGNAHDHLVTANHFHDIYDTAVTNQNHSARVSQHNIYYTNNRIINCGLASFEFWTRPENSQAWYIYFLHNTSVNPGHGWGAVRPSTNSFHVASFSHQADTGSIVLSGNIFATLEDPGAEGEALMYFDSNPSGSDRGIVLDDNLWYSVVTGGTGYWIFGLDSELESYSDLDDLRSVTGMAAGGDWGDPLLADPGNGDFTIDPASPAVDLVPVPFSGIRDVDALGASVPTAADAGAIEQ